MKKIVVLIGDHFAGGLSIYTHTLTAMKSKGLNVSEAPIISSKPVIGTRSQIAVSPYLTTTLENNDYAKVAPGQPGFYIINPAAMPDDGILLMNIPARGTQTNEFISSLETDIGSVARVIPILINPASVEGGLRVLIRDRYFGLTDTVAAKVFSQYVSRYEWRSDIKDANPNIRTIEFSRIDMLREKLPAIVADIVNYVETYGSITAGELA